MRGVVCFVPLFTLLSRCKSAASSLSSLILLAGKRPSKCREFLNVTVL